MPDDDSGSEISESREQSASHRWRGRLLSKTGKLGKVVDKAIREKTAPAQQESDVSTFLHGPGEKPVAKPRVEISSVSRWPTAAAVLGAVERPGSSSSRPGTASSSRPATAHSSSLPALPPRRKKIPKGLRVKFSTAAPEIIGEGGDESELPPKDVRRAWAQSGSFLHQRPVQSAIDRTEARREAALPAALVPAYDRRSQRSPPPTTTTTVQRKPVASLDDRIHTEAGGDVALPSQQASQSTPAQLDAQPSHSLSRPYPEPDLSPMRKPDSSSSFPRQYLNVRSGNVDSKGVEQVREPQSDIPLQSERPIVVERKSSQKSADIAPSASLSAANDASIHQPATPITPTYGYKDVVSPYLDEFLHEGPAQDSSKADGKTEEFYSRVEHLHGVFYLASQSSSVTADESVALWIRVSSWWFLKGRNGLENKIRTSAEQLSGPSATPQSPSLALQCYVDLAKAWWIAREIIPGWLQQLQQPSTEVIDGIDSLEPRLLQQAYASLQANMDALTISMQKGRFLPPSSLLIQGLDSTIWIDYPVLSSDILALTADVDPSTTIKRISPNKHPFFPILLGDTDRHFSYGRMFVEVEIVSEYEGLDEYQLPCILSIIRERADSRVEATIVSQNGCINLHVQSDKERGPTWEDVEWKIRSHSIRIRLAEGLELAVRFWDADFKTLWGIHDYNRRVEREWCAEENEKVVFTNIADSFHYIPPADSQNTFPSKPVRSCKIRLFESSHVPFNGSLQGNTHSGHRLVAITPPDSKSLSSIGTAFGPANPILFSYLRGDGSKPALLLSIRERGIKSTMILTFHDLKKRAELHALLNGTYVWDHESISAKFHLDDFSMSLLASDIASTVGDLALVPGIQWEYVRVIERRHHNTPHTEIPPLSNRRIVMKSNLGTITDRINSSPGELQIGLSTTNTASLKILHPAQEDLTISFAENLLGKGDWQTLSDTLSAVSSSPTIRTYNFHSLQDLHAFQSLVTGFSVAFDDTAASLSISRRRMVVPLHKHVEALSPRLQIIRNNNTNTHNHATQLLAIFHNFPLGRCMNFSLKGTDVFEAFARGGKYYVRFVDAKFSLPRGAGTAKEGLGKEGDEAAGFLSLDVLAYGTEHDDIVVGFESEPERDRFAATLPAAVVKLGKMAALRK